MATTTRGCDAPLTQRQGVALFGCMCVLLLMFSYHESLPTLVLVSSGTPLPTTTTNTPSTDDVDGATSSPNVIVAVEVNVHLHVDGNSKVVSNNVVSDEDDVTESPMDAPFPPDELVTTDDALHLTDSPIDQDEMQEEKWAQTPIDYAPQDNQDEPCESEESFDDKNLEEDELVTDSPIDSTTKESDVTAPAWASNKGEVAYAPETDASEQTTAEPSFEATTAQPAVEDTTAQALEPTTAQPTFEETTAQPAEENTTEQAVEETTALPSMEATTGQPFVEEKTAQPQADTPSSDETTVAEEQPNSKQINVARRVKLLRSIARA